MTSDARHVIRCAIYTRKSSEEGLEQAFNSLDAQREACQAYIQSQRHEGWRAIKSQYDDGGYSGGTMDRPALGRLLEDIRSRQIDTVVVYKVDRLTRSLADFAKIIEIFDAHSVSFVSVTQQFNTTTSMGRLTLNVLLSFAQFEREVTGERIRDKIAASKRKGMWMGGVVPLGYGLQDHKLIVNASEAESVRKIYHLYLELGSVAQLKAHLDKAGMRSKIRVSQGGRRWGGSPYSRGALYELLQNRIYLGEITHRGKSYPGEHQAIVDPELWERVQAQLKTNNDSRRNGLRAAEPSLLAGLLQDGGGNRFTPTHAVKNGRRYRYYVSQAAIHKRGIQDEFPTRIPAGEIEALVTNRLHAFLTSGQALVESLAIESDHPAELHALTTAAARAVKIDPAESPALNRASVRAAIGTVVLHDENIEIQVRRSAVRAMLANGFETVPAVNGHKGTPAEGDIVALTVNAHLRRSGRANTLVLQQKDQAQQLQIAPSLVKAIARARSWYERALEVQHRGGRDVAKDAGFSERYISRILPFAFLAPDIVEMILDGKQPSALGVANFADKIPLEWSQQRRMIFGIG